MTIIKPGDLQSLPAGVTIFIKLHQWGLAAAESTCNAFFRLVLLGLSILLFISCVHIPVIQEESSFIASF